MAKPKTTAITTEMQKCAKRLIKRPLVANMGFSANSVAKMMTAYSSENPSFDINDFTPFVIYHKKNDDETRLNKVIISMIRKYCKNCSVIARTPKGEAALLIGKAADEINSKCKIKWETMTISKTGLVKIDCSFPINSKLKCFNGNKVIDSLM